MKDLERLKGKDVTLRWLRYACGMPRP